MQIIVNGDVATVKATFKFNDLKKVGTASLKDAEGNVVYMVATGATAGVVETGATFQFADAEGLASFNLKLCTTDAAAIREALATNAGIKTLAANEKAIGEAIQAELKAREALLENVTIA